MAITANTDVNTLLLAAQAALQDVQPGEIFTVRELFRGFEWKRIPTGIRIQLGSVFYVYAQGAGSSLMTEHGKTKQNQQQYIRK